MKKNWKRVRPTSLLHAQELCVEHGREVKNAGVDRLAEGMGEESHHNLYKWLATGRMPLVKLRAFENACGATFVTRWLAMSAGLLVIDIPTGRKADGESVLALQQALNDAVGALLQFYAGKEEQAAVLARITAGLEGLAFHRENVKKYEQPELEFGGPA